MVRRACNSHLHHPFLYNAVWLEQNLYHAPDDTRLPQMHRDDPSQTGGEAQIESINNALC
jgi:hypothetical protein